MDAIKLLGSLMGNKSLSSGLGGKLLGGLLGGGGRSNQSSGLAGILGGMLGGGGSRGGGGGLSGLLGSVMGGGGGLSGLLGSVMGGGSGEAQQATEVSPDQRQTANEQAILMIRAMVNAAKSDGRIDQAEQENIVSKLGDEVSAAEIDFLKQEFAAPLDVAGFARSVPEGMETQIYAVSLTSIELDTQNEANYLGQLAQAMNLDPAICNQIHEHLDAPKIFG